MIMEIVKMRPFRWKAVAVYQQRNGPDIERSWMIQELIELHDAIERGPNCAAIKSITITYNGEGEYQLGDEEGDMDAYEGMAEVIKL